MTARILVVEDDPSIRLGLSLNLRSEGYEVEEAEDGLAGLDKALDGGFDLVVLDLNLPGPHGFEVLRRMREAGVPSQVLVLSARDGELDKVAGLDLGADDYVTKPFGLSELLARVRVALRRRGSAAPATWQYGDVLVDPETREVRRSGDLIELTATEFDLLAALAGASGRVLSREQLYERVWGEDRAGSRRTVDNFVGQLRAKLEADPTQPRHLVTVRGVGYRLIR